MRKFIAYFLCAIGAACVFMLSACSSPTDAGSTGEGENSTISAPKVPSKDLDISELAECQLYADVGDKYDVVIQPFKDMSKYIIDDLIENEIVTLPEDYTIKAIRYMYGRTIWFEIRRIPKIYGTETNSDFLYKNCSVCLKSFLGTDDDWHEYEYFLQAERGCAGSKDYVDIMLPHAERIANKIKTYYDEYKANGGYEHVEFEHNAEDIVLKANSSLPETYNKILSHLNEIVKENNLPLLTDQDIKIHVGGVGVKWFNSISIKVDLQNYHYQFYADFNSEREFDDEWLLYYKNSLKAGYWSPDEELVVPKNEEYPEFFDKMKFEQLDSLYFQMFITENSMLYFC